VGGYAMKKLIITIVSLVAIMSGVSIRAQSQEISNADPCSADIQKFCKGVKPGGGTIAACMKEHSQELSQSCKSHVAALEGNVKLFAKACKSDFQKYCKGVKPGEGRIIFCLKEHETDLSDSCRNLLTRQYDKK
jgi:hypothetical protein